MEFTGIPSHSLAPNSFAHSLLCRGDSANAIFGFLNFWPVPAYIVDYGIKLIMTACQRNDGGRMMLLCGIGASLVGFWFVARIIGMLLNGGK